MAFLGPKYVNLHPGPPKAGYILNFPLKVSEVFENTQKSGQDDWKMFKVITLGSGWSAAKDLWSGIGRWKDKEKSVGLLHAGPRTWLY